MSEYLFTYGTLRPGRAPAEIAAAVRTLRVVGTGRIRGTLYDLGEYPGAVLDADAAEIDGTVFELPDVPGILGLLDAYEEFDPGGPEASLFVRELHPVMLDTGGTLTCWVYVYNRAPAGARVVCGGRWF
ncbi:MAG TPA: gamma-glutamylcyclotransferase family protein [Terracidiphilus sp.]|nr:gamma-glutamylcyclotransferase family protein [Terracidiphilus sp.]